MPLLGLELTDLENKQENPIAKPQSAKEPSQGPLLGTNSLKSLVKSSETRSSERVCYESLLRFGAHSPDLNIRKTVRNAPRGCYGFGVQKLLRIAKSVETVEPQKLESHL